MTPHRAMPLPGVDFHNIRPHGSPPSLADAFEELASILIREGLIQWPADTELNRFGNPDGGREGRGVLQDGTVWAWQVKYLFKFGDREARQVHESFVRTLDTDPDLARYYVVLPYDLPAGDKGGKRPTKSAFTRWSEKVEEWKALAASRGKSVEIHYLGLTSLIGELTRPQHAGRIRYWFNASELSADSMEQRLDDVVAKAGRRYTPEVHVDVDASVALEGLGRTAIYAHRVQTALAGLRKALGDSWHAPAGDEAAFQTVLVNCRASLAAAESAVSGLLDEVRIPTGEWPTIAHDVGSAESALHEVESLLQERHLRSDGVYVDQASFLYSTIKRAREALWLTASLADSVETEAAKVGSLLLTGRAGVGKTHLFCDVAVRRISAGMPTVMGLGQDFSAAQLLQQIPQVLQLEGSLDNALAVLDAAGEASGHLAMLMLDAVNEATDPERWVDDLRVLVAKVNRHPNVVLAVSCRTEFVAHVVGDDSAFPVVTHVGFAEATSEAIDRYTREYGLERLMFPLMNPEYENPLFLKLACEALSTLGDDRFAIGSASLSTVCEAFIDAVNKRLSAPTRCDFDESTNLVSNLSLQLVTLGAGPYKRDEVRQMAESTLPNRHWSDSLMLGMLREGVLTAHGDDIAFGYQRLGDVIRASVLAELSDTDLTAWYASLDEDSAWEERGTLGALAVIAPEKRRCEVIDLFKDTEGRVDSDIVDAFVESLAMRAPQDTTDRTADLLKQLIDQSESSRGLWDQVIRVACMPGHKVNADWMHGYLLSTALPERDTSWSEWLVRTIDHGHGGVRTLLEWGWPDASRYDPSPLPDEVSRLATLALGWMLTTPDRRVRDRATKALVNVGERGLGGFTSAIAAFASCDDPYVTERLTAAVCALTLRTSERAEIHALADAAVSLLGDAWPTHLLTRDYVRRTLTKANELDWNGPDGRPPYGAKWPVRSLPARSIEAMIGPPDREYSSIWHSLHALGDFGTYVLEPALEKFDYPDLSRLRTAAERAILTRVVQLGWSGERFAALDRHRHGGHDGHVERFGKKYQWIGLYEVLGRLADNRKLVDRWDNEEPPFDYEYAEQLVYRDIDASVLTSTQPAVSGTAVRTWYAPVQATFPSEVASNYPRSLDGVPDPIDLIALTDSNEERWLSLVRHENWTQALPPEIQAMNAPNLNVWMQIRGYLLPIEQASALESWAKDADWDGRWMAENAQVHNRLLASHPQAPDWDAADGNAEPRGPVVDAIPTPLFQPVAWYGGTGTSRESTGINEPTGYVPSRMLIDALDLRRSGDFEWADVNGLALSDPTAGVEETSTLVVRRDLVGNLASAGFTLFWTVLLNKQRQDHTYGAPDDDYRWLSASAAYLMTAGELRCLSAKASRRGPYGTGEPEVVKWVVRQSD
jgi:hypothetical protein